MSSWGTKRRNLIITIFLIGLFVILATTAFTFFYEEPNCFDGTQNQGEEGVDCGGPCELLCEHQNSDPLVRWNRYFELVPGIYNAVAYLENQNSNAGTDNLKYKFTLYDEENAIIAERINSIELRPAEIIPIVENNLNTGNLEPARMTFEIIEESVWKKTIPRQPVIRVRNDRLTMNEGVPRVTAELENNGFTPVTDLKAVVILYNSDSNAIGVSSTVVDEIQANQSRNILFTWPQNFSGEVSRFEIVPLYDSE